jgi:hypothetical protein
VVLQGQRLVLALQAPCLQAQVVYFALEAPHALLVTLMSASHTVTLLL